MHSLQVENGLSVAHASHFSHLHGEGFELQKRVCPFPQVVEGRRMEKGLGHNIEPLQVFIGHVQCRLGRQPHQPLFVVGSAVDTKDARKGRPPMPSMLQTGKAYRLACPLPFRVRTTMFTTSLRYFLNCFRDLSPRPCPYRDSFLTQMRVLTLNSSDGDAINARFSQTLLSTNA